MDVEILAAVLIGLLALASVTAMVLGVLGAFGALPIARCAQCGRMAVMTRKAREDGCAKCRHPHFVDLHRKHSRAARAQRS